MSNQILLYFMNKALSIQRSKIISAYGGVGTNIDTIDNLSLIIRPFDEWNLYDKLKDTKRNKHLKRLLFKEERLCARLKSIGFTQLEQFFLLEDFANEEPVKTWSPAREDADRMVTSLYFPRWFYCPKCHRFKPIEEWKDGWNIDDRWNDNIPACSYCSRRMNRNVKRAPLHQIRFVMVSMETGEIVDIPWNRIFSKKGISDKPNVSVWYIDENTPTRNDVKFIISKGSADLHGISVVDENDAKITMAEIMTRYIVMTDIKGNKVVYHPVIRNANNVYFGYNISSVFIPRKEIPVEVVGKIKTFVDKGISDPIVISGLLSLINIQLTADEIKEIIDSGFTLSQSIVYTSEDDFRKDEFDFLTDPANYNNSGRIYTDDDDRLISELFEWTDNKPDFISEVYFQRKINITSVQVAYSRIDKISASSLPNWKGKNDLPKQWYDPAREALCYDVNVKLHPTCKTDIDRISMMPAVSSFGEGFFLQLNLSSIDKDDRFVFLHTFCHLIMKELEFSCGYPLASLNERLYFLPDNGSDNGGNSKDRFGFLVYSANGESGSYGGITSLFYSGKIKNIIKQAVLLALDCPNDPICENDKGHCFACVDLPETSCEEFNKMLNRLVVKKYTAKYECETAQNLQDNEINSSMLVLDVSVNSNDEDDDILD